jgi:hypothetical protein
MVRCFKPTIDSLLSTSINHKGIHVTSLHELFSTCTCKCTKPHIKSITSREKEHLTMSEKNLYLCFERTLFKSFLTTGVWKYIHHHGILLPKMMYMICKSLLSKHLVLKPVICFKIF